MIALSRLPKLKTIVLQRSRVSGGWRRLSLVPPRTERLTMESTPCSRDGLLALSKVGNLQGIAFHECAGVTLEEIGRAWGRASTNCILVTGGSSALEVSPRLRCELSSQIPTWRRWINFPTSM